MNIPIQGYGYITIYINIYRGMYIYIYIHISTEILCAPVSRMATDGADETASNRFGEVH